ncbi:RlpA-like double-psi beta-barrel-protein domain-containing protein-containing protein [Fusarium tricinctum]|jgi:rare lipoprotein A (peptidoglycan hydrolase)|uniref:RlpA-like double-psi beta-barrel-protein domain-containing protein-containing protein n=1 Tax=Fusarium tricinctum TaxID=61284 RepID=A0A8K0RWI6_9HYPO|nr:RlpA-like double-psi beta-barrel-protein domain-containing protein-containing protein [Fusarium tricinctum]
MIFSTLSTVFLGLAASISSVAAGPCKPGSTQSLDEQSSTVTATSRALDITTTALSSDPTTTSHESTSLPAVTTTVAAPEVFAGGMATWYHQYGNPSQCGGTHRDDELVVALDYRRFDMSLCGKKIRVTNGSNGRTVDVTVVESCPSCLNGNSLDMSVEAFNRIGSFSDGSYFVTWSFI